MRGTAGAALDILGWVVGGIAWLATTIGLWLGGNAGLALLAFSFPPADVILAFIVSPLLGVAALGALALLVIAAAVGGSR